jgi:DNA helicase-2/ATP-dependent DNA helicase PcrA
MDKYEGLNPNQKEAVYHTEGPLLILAGAGSGKTRVLTHRIAYLIEEKKVAPWNIMAITFTNKAAREMRERVDKLSGQSGSDVWVSTFHSSCVRILRRHIDKIGYDRYFTIYDTDDQKKLIRESMKQLNVDPKYYKESAVLSAISGAKNQLISPEEYKKQAVGDLRKETISKVYILYQDKLKSNNALDFDDLLVKAVELFVGLPSVLEEYQNKFKYIMVDEYQDTNGVQFKLVSLLAGKHRNLCVVGDDDQSIYKFRGADITNILDFEKIFSNTKVIRLEQNYRSTSSILNVANEVISNNIKRKPKKLWTQNDGGDKIVLNYLQSEQAEAQYVAEEIVKGIEEDGKEYKDYAILYRTNAQSRVLEERFIKENIPYKIVGGISFYQRKEIKDILAYLKIINNSIDDLAVKRIINVPKRGIGQTSIQKVESFAYDNELSFFEALVEVGHIPNMSRAANKIQNFVNMILTLRTTMPTISLVEFTDLVLENTGYKKELELEGTQEANDRLDNIGELISKLKEYETNNDDPTLNGFLEEVALVADIDNYNQDANVVVLMTLHSAKGLEFPYVFMTGLEDGLFPSYMSITSDNEDDIEEERRLCYVGITRAMKNLYITCSKSRMIHGQTQYNRVSRFVTEMPDDLLEKEEVVLNEMPEIKSRNYGKRNNIFFNSKPYNISKSTTSIPKPNNFVLDFEVGDLVKHSKFGVGQVEKIEAGGADYQVTANFPSVGIKKLLAGLSGLKKI